MNKKKISAAVSGFGWLSGAQLLSAAIRFIGGIYLARTISPAFFGQQGLALSITAIVYSFVMIGDAHALIKQQNDVYRYMRALFSIRVFIVIVLVVILSILWVTGWLPGTREVQLYTIILFFSQVPAEIASIYLAYIARQMLFIRLAVLNILSTLSGVVTACILAYLGYTIWALLWLFMAEQLVVAGLSFFLAPMLFLPKFDKKLAKDFFHYSKYFSATSLLDRIKSKVDNISVGSLVGEAPLGYYQRAYGLGDLIQMAIMGSLSTVIQPYFARMQGDREKFGRYFELIGSFLIRVSCIAFICLAFILPEVIDVLYGEQWLPAVPIFRVMLPFAILQSLRSLLRDTYKVAGSIKLLAIAQIIELVALIVFLIPMIYWKGVLGAAIAINISSCCGVAVMLFYLRQYAEFSIRKIFANPLIASVIAAAVMMWFKSSVSIPGDLLNVGITIGIFTISFAVTLLLLEYSYIKKTITLFILNKAN